jgi:hypothetical protein
MWWKMLVVVVDDAMLNYSRGKKKDGVALVKKRDCSDSKVLLFSFYFLILTINYYLPHVIDLGNRQDMQLVLILNSFDELKVERINQSSWSIFRNRIISFPNCLLLQILTLRSISWFKT